LFDPACGSGNFLIIAYKELRNLEIRIWKQMREVTGQAIIPFVNIQLHQFYGIEIDDFCHETAILSLWLAEHQMNNLFRKEFDVKIQALPLRPSGNIVCANACRIDWEDVCPHTKDEEVFIMGNPPYLGGKLQNAEQKDDLGKVFSNFSKYKNLDYVSCWFLLGANYINGTESKYSFVSTNSICQGDTVFQLWPAIFSLGLEIKFAHTSFKWTNNAKGQAGVICVIVGVGKKSNDIKFLYKDNNCEKGSYISAYLSFGSTMIVKSHPKPISKLQLLEYGNMPLDGGFLKLNRQDKDDILMENPLSCKFIRPLVGSYEYINSVERYCLWIENEDLEEAKSNKIINNRINKVRIFRENGGDVARTLVNRSHQFRYRKQAKESLIIIPKVSSERRKYIPIGYLAKETIVHDSAQVIYDPELWGVGIIMSYIHMVWVRSISGKLKNDFQYTVSLSYNTFPFPEISEEKKKEIEEAAEEVLCVRAEHSEKTLAEMYDPEKMPADLRAAHHTLDLIVESCYRKEPFTSDEERLEHLFKLYEKMTTK